MSKVIRGARPVKSKVILDYYQTHNYRNVNLTEYADTWKNWMEFTSQKTIAGLDEFPHVDYTQGTSQSFDNFVLRHGNSRQIVVVRGDFQYHACVSKAQNFRYVDLPLEYECFDQPNLAVIISVPFSDYGTVHPMMQIILDDCERHDNPVILDLAYWGISKNVHLDLTKYKSIKEVTSSLSKPFYTLENHRVGVRFAREYCDDGISMLNEVNMQNKHSMSLGVHYMNRFSPDWNWQQFGKKYTQICAEHNLIETDTVIFGRSNQDKHQEFNRGIPDNHRICISEMLGDIH